MITVTFLIFIYREPKKTNGSGQTPLNSKWTAQRKEAGLPSFAARAFLGKPYRRVHRGKTATLTTPTSPGLTGHTGHSGLGVR